MSTTATPLIRAATLLPLLVVYRLSTQVRNISNELFTPFDVSAISIIGSTAAAVAIGLPLVTAVLFRYVNFLMVGGLSALWGFVSFLGIASGEGLSINTIINPALLYVSATTLLNLENVTQTLVGLSLLGAAGGYVFGPRVRKKNNYQSKRAPTGEGRFSYVIGEGRVKRAWVAAAALIIALYGLNN